MTGHVDAQLRALIRVPVAATRDGLRTELVTWIDTAFTGTLAIPKKDVITLGLVQESTAEAILADGHAVELETYSCVFDWFGTTYKTQVTASDAAFPLLGTQLLNSRRLVVDFAGMTVELD